MSDLDNINVCDIKHRKNKYWSNINKEDLESYTIVEDIYHRIYFLNKQGNLHRLTGPAIISNFKNISFYCLHGRQLNITNWNLKKEAFIKLEKLK